MRVVPLPLAVAAMTLDHATGDDPVLCHLCGKDMSLAMIVYHLEHEHGIDPDEIANAPIVSAPEENEQFDPKHPERGWHEAEPMKAPRHWPWLQCIVDWLWRR